MIGSQHPFYDYSKLIASAKDESQYESFSTFIDEKIHEFREEHFAGEVRCFNRSVLAEMIGVESSTLTKLKLPTPGSIDVPWKFNTYSLSDTEK